MPEPMGPTPLSGLLPARRVASLINYGRKLISPASQATVRSTVKGAIKEANRINQRAATALSGRDPSKAAAGIRGTVALGKEAIKAKEQRQSKKRNQKNNK